MDVEQLRFIFWEAIKVLGVIFLGLLATKAVTSLPLPASTNKIKGHRGLEVALHSAILAMGLLGAWYVGYDVAAESYYWASQGELDRKKYLEAYINAQRAVQLRPETLRYWRNLTNAKMYLRQYDSALDDMPLVQSLSGGHLDEADAYRFAVCYFLRGQYENVIATTQQLIRQNPPFAAPYILQGMAYTAQKRFPEAQKSFQQLLQMFPDNQAAVEGLAHAYFLAGYRSQALDVLNQTAKRPFSPEARKRFEALKGLYAQ